MIRRSFDENGDYAINNFIEGTPATAQAVTTRLRLFKGEWFLNLNSGVPWFQEVFVKPARIPQVEQIIRDTILRTEGVAALTSFNLTFDGNIRRLTISFTGKTTWGDDFTEVIGLNPIGG